MRMNMGNKMADQKVDFEKLEESYRELI